ncbi:hypothetical protein UPYG_G00248650 [Umbra pygmaea]|uniref:Uncharacterized protein n=1 Tax=Umbra pygmaea TaxID=75934 RepID=A0ABD0WS99_UMBPY
MSGNDVFHTQLSHFIEFLVESSVREMGRLLEDCVAVLEGEENSLLKSEMERLKTTNTKKFASFMEGLSKSLMEKISLLITTIEEAEVIEVDQTCGNAVISVNPEVNSCVVIVGPHQGIREAVLTQKEKTNDDGSACDSDGQEADPTPMSDEDWLPDDSRTKSAHTQAPFAFRMKRPRCTSHTDQQAQGRSEEDTDVQCVDSTDDVRKSSLICSHCEVFICPEGLQNTPKNT